MPDAIKVVFRDTVVQTCVVHVIRNAMRFVSYGDRKKIAKDMREIYTAPTLEATELALAAFDKQHGAQYPGAVDVWRNAWNDFIPFLDALLRGRERSAEAELRPVSRVVLYVDDLDRCPPAKVLEVLEAVHLLLALEQFVVVVGVDPRWLSSSLWHQYRDLAAGQDPRADAYLRGMPIEYLEKIFQIPFTLPAMEPEAYARLVGSVADVSEPIPSGSESPSTTNPAE